MKMTLKEARDCLDANFDCRNCKFNTQKEFDCRGTAYEIGVSALNYLMVGQKLSKEAEEKER